MPSITIKITADGDEFTQEHLEMFVDQLHKQFIDDSTGTGTTAWEVEIVA
jgi:hypothetical protein